MAAWNERDLMLLQMAVHRVQHLAVYSGRPGDEDRIRSQLVPI